jgi:mono/diheme cytochrome c family protein
VKEWLCDIGALSALGGLILGFIGMATGCTLFEDKVVATGRNLFNYYCADCHGETGVGDGYNSDFLDPEPRDLTDSEEKYLTGLTNEELFGVLYRDLKGEAPAFGRHVPVTMPTYKNTLSEAELWSLVAYVRTLHPNDAPKIVITPEMKRKRPKFPRIRKVDFNSGTLINAERVEYGKRLFRKTYSCFGCHSVEGEGGRIGPALDRAGFISNPDYLYLWTKNPQAFKTRTKMPNLGVTDEHALAITAYLATLREPVREAAAGDQPQP